MRQAGKGLWACRARVGPGPGAHRVQEGTRAQRAAQQTRQAGEGRQSQVRGVHHARVGAFPGAACLGACPWEEVLRARAEAFLVGAFPVEASLGEGGRPCGVRLGLEEVLPCEGPQAPEVLPCVVLEEDRASDPQVQERCSSVEGWEGLRRDRDRAVQLGLDPDERQERARARRLEGQEEEDSSLQP